MKKQKICIIGGGLTGLVTAIGLSELDCNIDLISGKINQNYKTNSTLAISQNNYYFLKKLKIFNSSGKELWPCSQMKLYSEIENEKFLEIFEFDKEKSDRKILYMIKNSDLIKLMIKKIRDTKSISLKENSLISEIKNFGALQGIKNKKNFKASNDSKYNLIIVCTGNDSKLVNNFFDKKMIKNSYNETSITTILNHRKTNNNIARQIFLKDEILALLPLSNSQTSIVWSLKNNIYKKDKNLFKKKIELYSKNFLTEIKFLNKIESKSLNFLIRNKYYNKRTLLFGDLLHMVHPLAGQGFNMTLRDLSFLKKILRNKIKLGLDIGNTDVLSEFTDLAKPRNFAYSIGIDFLKRYFSFNSYFKLSRNYMLKKMNKNNAFKEILFSIADKGLKF